MTLLNGNELAIRDEIDNNIKDRMRHSIFLPSAADAQQLQ